MMHFLETRKKIYCAFCKNPRKVYTKKKASLFDKALFALLAAFLMLIIWDGLDPRGIFFFLVFWFSAEVFFLLRWRSSLVCRHCGFDPQIYLASPERAVVLVKEKLQKRKLDPEALLKPTLKLKPLISAETTKVGGRQTLKARTTEKPRFISKRL